MLAEVNRAKEFLVKKFGSTDKVPAGAYAIPTPTSAGNAFMKVEISERGFMSDFTLFWDEELKISWYTHNKNGSEKQK